MGKIKVSYYLTEQLEKLGISDFFGLPGDYNFKLIESVEKNPSTNWIGCTNELNAGYAADGYARVKGYGALITTYGVGELSAINAIAGCFAENIPVIKIVGVPATKFIEQNTVLHHNFEHPDYYAFEKAYSSVVETTAYLNKTNAKSEIDRVLSVFVNQKRSMEKKNRSPKGERWYRCLEGVFRPGYQPWSSRNLGITENSNSSFGMRHSPSRDHSRPGSLQILSLLA